MSILASRADRELERLPLRSFARTERSHRKELATKLRQMPFIYRDLELDLLTDFVDIELGSLTRKTPVGNNAIRTPLFHRLRDSRRLLLLGPAGAGKTSLFRYSILSLVLPGKGRLRLNQREDPLPFYVPMKAISNTDLQPVLKYLLASNSYLSGKKGMRRLVRLARAHRIMLFLDGYDEVPYAGGTSQILSELRDLFGPLQGPPTNVGSGNDAEDFYRAIVRNRVWISSRSEFMRSNQFPISADVTQLEVLGLGEQRIELVKRIFDKYRGKSTNLAEELSEEHFIQQITLAGDSALEELSRSPLFLTVMCYVYVQELLEGKDMEGVWSRGVHDLIQRCVEMLVRDIDEYKARGLPELQRVALVRRRAAYSTEKLQLLGYVAAQSFVDSVAVFRRDQLETYARSFFEAPSQATAKNSRAILNGLSKEDPAGNLITQLIFAGIFVNVDITSGAIYDFPHRRFREVLAADFLNTNDGCDLICAHAGKANFAELIFVYLERTKYWARVIDALTESVLQSPGDLSLAFTFEGALKRAPSLDAATGALFALISKAFAGKTHLKLPRTVLHHLRPGQDHPAWLQEAIVDVMDEQDADLLMLLGPVATRVNSQATTESLRLAWQADGLTTDFKLALFSVSMDTSESLFGTALTAMMPTLADVKQNPQMFSDVCYLLFRGSATTDRLRTAQRLAGHYGDAGWKWVLGWLSTHDVALYHQLAKPTDIPPWASKAILGQLKPPNLPAVFITV